MLLLHVFVICTTSSSKYIILHLACQVIIQKIEIQQIAVKKKAIYFQAYLPDKSKVTTTNDLIINLII